MLTDRTVLFSGYNKHVETTHGPIASIATVMGLLDGNKDGKVLHLSMPFICPPIFSNGG